MVLRLGEHHALGRDELSPYGSAVLPRELHGAHERLADVADDAPSRSLLLRIDAQLFAEVVKHLDVVLGLTEVRLPFPAQIVVDGALHGILVDLNSPELGLEGLKHELVELLGIHHGDLLERRVLVQHSKCIEHATPAVPTGGFLAADIRVLTFQAIFALLRRSLGSAVRAIFGWATVALFGVVAESERTLLSLAVGAAGVWPAMVFGVFFPKAAAVVLALLPIPKSVPASVLRGVWIALTLLIPIGVGLVLARHARIERSRWRRILMGFPATLGIAAAFLVAFVAVPIGKLVAFVKGRREDHVGLVISPERSARSPTRCSPRSERAASSSGARNRRR